jgi:tetratricopeptide (TPR) repeat protein
LFNLILCTLQLKRIEETWELIEKELSYYREYPEYSFMKAIVYQYFAFYGLAEQELWNAIQAAETLAASNRDFWLISPDYGNVTPYQNLAGIYLRRKDLKRAIECFTRILKIRPYDLASLVRLMGLLSFREPADAILSFLGKLYPEQSETDRTLIYYAALHVGNRDLLDHVEPTLPETIQLTPAEVLRAALVRQDEEKFRKTVSTLSPKQLLDDVTFKHLMLGVLIWHTADWLERADMSSREFYPRVRETVLDLLEGRLDPQMLEDAAVRTYLCTLLTELFNLGHYEAYDQWVNRLTHPMVIDYLANFFYSRNQLDIAVNYFSLLLRETDDLPNETLESLFFMHLNENLVEDGLGFLRHAIDKDPDKVQYYTLYCLYARDPSEKREMKSQLLQRFPQYGQLPFIRNL